MRIASLVPSATETLFALGLGADVVAVTHECDWPREATSLPHLTRSVIPDALGPAEIDAAVREAIGAGKAIYELDHELLAELEPDLIVTQALCEVCAVSYEDVRAVAERLPGSPRVIALDPMTLAEVFGDIDTVGREAGEQRAASGLRERLEARIAAVRDLVVGAERVRTVALEWLDPPFAGGHWIPELIGIAGGFDVLGRPGVKSATVEWAEVAASRPQRVIVMPCGLYADEAATQARGFARRLEGLGAEAIVAVDAASSFSRPGPRLVDGVELLAHLLHPDRAPDPGGVGFRRL